MEYIYPAIVQHNEDGTYTISYPDLPGCVSEGKNLADALRMASLALEQWLEYLSDEKMPIPGASRMEEISAGKNAFVNLICVDIKDGRAVRRTVSIPRWMDDSAANAGLSLSRVLQEALAKKLLRTS